MPIKDRMILVDTNLDDVQSGMEATSRAADTLQTDTTKTNGFAKSSWLRALVRHVKELQACARDQQAAMQELRDGIARLQEELRQSSAAVRPPPLMRGHAAHHTRRRSRVRSR